jgi:hypothetical protein
LGNEEQTVVSIRRKCRDLNFAIQIVALAADAPDRLIVVPKVAIKLLLRILQNIRVLRERFEPEVVAKEQALKKPRRAKAATGVYRALSADASWRMPLQ